MQFHTHLALPFVLEEYELIISTAVHSLLLSPLGSVCKLLHENYLCSLLYNHQEKKKKKIVSSILLEIEN